ncbi:MAG: sodium/solute symporter [Saprospiraceae bacterium]|nr:sodium/solute symporter [Saprospiraceae bacterium]
MNLLDYSIILAYLVGFILLGFLFKKNESSKDYFLGGNSLGWFPLSLSTMATQLSAISFISAPAFVGLKMGGGLKWLTFEMAVPIAMLFIMLVVIPPLFRAGIVSIYEYAERRFDYSTRMILSIVFQINRALSTGVMVYAIAFILQAVLNLDFSITILIISVITIIYSWQGGMKAVVWGDAIQMIILFIGLIVCLIYGWTNLSAIGETITFDPKRLQVIDMNWGIGEGEEYGLFPMIIGGFFLYVSYYGCDQTQAQRMLSAKNEGTIKKLLLANGLLRFPVVLVYCIMGLIIGSLVMNTPEFLSDIQSLTEQHFPQEYASNGIKADLMMPVFILNYLPHGLIGLLMIGIMSAAMSSLSSTINSLSAVTVEDILKRQGIVNDTNYMQYSKFMVVFWGVICIGAAFLFGGSDSPVIEIINAIGSVFYGPVLATFVLAIFSKKISSSGMKIGIILSVLINLIFSKTMQGILGFDPGVSVFWIWLNFTGFFIAVGFAYLVSYLFPSPQKDERQLARPKFTWDDFLCKESYILVGFFVFIIALCAYLPQLLS